MKATLYLVERQERLEAHISVEWAVDRLFWLDGDFRAGVAQALGPSALPPAADALAAWPERLPLGLAAEAAARWNAAAEGRPPLRGAAAWLARCVRAAGQGGGAAGQGAGAGARPGPFRRPAAPPLLRMARDAGARAAPERAAAAAQAAGLAARAERAAEALQGRALLAGEAHALLAAAGAAGPAGGAGSGWSGLAALQLAALLGRLCLRSAVAVEPWPLPRRRREERPTLPAQQHRPAGRGQLGWPTEPPAQPHGPAEHRQLGRPQGPPAQRHPSSGLAQCRRSSGRTALQPHLLERVRPRRPSELAERLRVLLHGLTALLPASPVRSGFAALLRPRRRLRCLRCGSGEARMRRTPCASCGQTCAYCEACLTMGRARECELLVLGAAASPLAAAIVPASAALDRWSLSPAQRGAVERALVQICAAHDHSLLQPGVSDPIGRASRTGQGPHIQPALRRSMRHSAPAREFLIWAVTGAGKTEMLFPLLETVLSRGGRALIATPRRDVVLELDPRIRRAFPDRAVVTLYGGSEQRWEAGEITIATTHQLFRFAHGFQLVVIDELDAFPFHGDEMLQYAARKACSPTGITVFLSATPPPEMQRAARRGSLPHARVPVRYHRRPLPVPRMLRVPSVARMLRRRRIPMTLMREIRVSVSRGAQLFIFVQRIGDAEPFANLLRSRLPGIAAAGVSSRSPDRADTVRRFRNREIRVLVTTTILERGVTVPNSDVMVLDADGKLFDFASLVQMAGRAGRSAEHPEGRVVFAGTARTRQQALAIRHIRSMNRLAHLNGHLLPARGG